MLLLIVLTIVNNYGNISLQTEKEGVIEMMNLYMDLDDTLIQTQQLFETYKEYCARYIECYDCKLELTYDEIMSYFNEREMLNMEIYGFENKRFILSWEETAKHFIPDMDTEAVKAIASLVFKDKAPLMDGAIETLENLTEKGYEITIITCGIDEVQNKRIDDVGIRHYFKDIHVVPVKDKETMGAIIEDPSNAVMIGNSMRSDIAPAVELGVRAIQVNAPNWFYDELEEAPEGKYYICNIEEVPTFVELHEHYNRTIGKI